MLKELVQPRKVCHCRHYGWLCWLPWGASTHLPWFGNLAGRIGADSEILCPSELLINGLSLFLTGVILVLPFYTGTASAIARHRHGHYPDPRFCAAFYCEPIIGNHSANLGGREPQRMERCEREEMRFPRCNLAVVAAFTLTAQSELVR